MNRKGIRRYVITPHALLQARRRDIDLGAVRAVLAEPEQRLTARPGRVVLQSRLISQSTDRVRLLRVVVDVDRAPAEVVTVYRTTNLLKYWKGER